MFGDRRTPLKVASTQDSVGPRFEASSSSYNPFDSDTESDDKSTPKPVTPTASKSGAIRKLGVEQSRTDVGKLWFGTKPGALESGLTHFDPMLPGLLSHYNN